MSVRIVQRPQYAHTSAACGVGTAAMAGEEQACDIATSRGFSPTTAPHGFVAESAESNLAGNLAFGRAVLLTRADGLEVPRYFSAYVKNKVVKMWLTLENGVFPCVGPLYHYKL